QCPFVVSNCIDPAKASLAFSNDASELVCAVGAASELILPMLSILLPVLGRIALLSVSLLTISTALSAAESIAVGKPLPAWKRGMLDIHQINTGTGDSGFYIFPDGTTMLLDAA